jgi:hypothetical protein
MSPKASDGTQEASGRRFISVAIGLGVRYRFGNREHKLTGVEKMEKANTKKTRRLIGAAIAGVTLSGVAGLLNQADAAVIYSPVVTQVGDGMNALTTAGTTTTIQVWRPNVANQVAPVAQSPYLSGASTVSSDLVNTGNASTEGNLTNNPALTAAAIAGQQYTGTAYVFSGGYAAADQTAAVDGNAAGAARVVGYMSVTSGSVGGATIGSSQTNATTYEGSNIRGVVGNDTATSFWSAGTGNNNTTTGVLTAGYRYFNNSTQLVPAPGPVNTRDVNIFGGQLYGTQDTGNYVGIAAIGTGTPTTSSQTATMLVSTAATSAVGDSPYAFVLFNNASAADPAGVPFNVAYIDDYGTASPANFGIQKWAYLGGSWTYEYSITDGNAATEGYFGLAGYLSGSNVVLYATQALASATTPNNLEQFTDPIGGSTLVGTDSEITLATSPANDAFRGVALAVPEPTTLGLLCAGALGLFVRPRRKA